LIEIQLVLTFLKEKTYIIKKIGQIMNYKIVNKKTKISIKQYTELLVLAELNESTKNSPDLQQ